MRAACTIVSKNYLAYANVLSQSFAEHHPDVPFYVLIVDRLSPGDIKGNENRRFEYVEVEELGITEFEKVAFKYNVLELNTNVKPTFLKWLARKGFEKIVYLDPDIYVYRPLDDVFGLLEKEADIVVTPHILTPVNDGRRPDDAEYLKNGIFNLGFIAVAARGDGVRFLDWWEARCLENAFNEPRSGVFVDQKWVNMLPCLFERHKILRAPGYNMAYWNLHERKLTLKDGEYCVNGTDPLIFFHFSGLSLSDRDQVSKHQNRYRLTDRPDLRELFDSYRNQLTKAGHERYAKLPYAFGVFTNGVVVNDLVRRVYANDNHVRWLQRDPFDSDGDFYRSVEKLGLLRRGAEVSAQIANANQMTVDFNDWRHRVMRRGFQIVLRILGVNRYTALMRYLSFVSILRNQSRIFF